MGETSAEVATLLAFIKQTLADKVEDVKSSDRLAQSPACLVAPAFGPDRQLIFQVFNPISHRHREDLLRVEGGGES